MWQDSELVRVCRRVHDRTWNQGLSGCATRLGTGKSLSNGLEFESQRSEFECRRLDPVSIGLEFVSVVHKGVMERNILAHRGTPCTHTKVLQVFHGQIAVGDIHYLLFLL